MDKKPVIILGASDVGVAAKDIFDSNGMIIYCFLDDDDKKHDETIGEVAVLGSTDDQEYLKLIGKKCDAFIASDDIKVRKSLVKMLNEKRKVMPVNAIHKSATISENAALGHGSFINAGVRIATNVKIGNHSLIHTQAVIDPFASLGEHVQVGAGSIINSRVTIEDEVFIGSGATLVSGITIGKGARIGAGSVVIADIAPGTTVFGNPAAPIE